MRRKGMAGNPKKSGQVLAFASGVLQPFSGYYLKCILSTKRSYDE